MLGTVELSGILPAPRGVPQIEITFDIDTNCILNITACDKTTGKFHRISVTNDKNRLSKEEIEPMVDEFETLVVEDAAAAARITAKNALESYSHNLRKFINDEKFKLETAVNETILLCFCKRS